MALCRQISISDFLQLMTQEVIQSVQEVYELRRQLLGGQVAEGE